MRLAAACSFAVLFAALPAYASLTVMLTVEQDAPGETLGELNHELVRLLAPAGVQLDLRINRDAAPGEAFDNLVMVTIKGQCTVAQDPMLIDERGPAPLAYTRTDGSSILPYAVISCDSVKRAVNGALWGGQHGQRDSLLGRALARVVAHELFHILEKTPGHSKSGVFREKLTGSQLISGAFDFAPADLRKLRLSAAP